MTPHDLGPDRTRFYLCGDKGLRDCTVCKSNNQKGRRAQCPRGQLWGRCDGKAVGVSLQGYICFRQKLLSPDAVIAVFWFEALGFV